MDLTTIIRIVAAIVCVLAVSIIVARRKRRTLKRRKV
jgi:hypothetical protein